MLSLLAEAYREAGRSEEGLKLLEEPLGRIGRTREGWIEAELHRVRGDLLLALPVPDHAGAEECHRRAMAVAHEQNPKMWELRAATSLARLWRDQGKRAHARACWRRSTAGSPRASIPKTSRMRRRCSTSWREPVSTISRSPVV
jgi:predicted ATPase